jgi:hypothetical protein
MTDGGALLADEVLPAKPIRQWVLSLPFALRFLLATDPDALTQVLGIVYRTISAHILKQARLTRAGGATGAVTLIQRFGCTQSRYSFPHARARRRVPRWHRAVGVPAN